MSVIKVNTYWWEVEQSVSQWLIQIRKINHGSDRKDGRCLCEVGTRSNRFVSQDGEWPLPLKAWSYNPCRKTNGTLSFKDKNFLEEGTNEQKKENTDFTCENCGANVKAVTNGSYRNHCPFCLYSKHLDNTPGDRNSLCKGLMKPLDLEYSNKKGYQIIHQCLQCNKIQKIRSLWILFKRMIS